MAALEGATKGTANFSAAIVGVSKGTNIISAPQTPASLELVTWEHNFSVMGQKGRHFQNQSRRKVCATSSVSLKESRQESALSRKCRHRKEENVDQTHIILRRVVANEDMRR